MRTVPEAVIPKLPSLAGMLSEISGCCICQQWKIGLLDDFLPMRASRVLILVRTVIQFSKQPSELGHRPWSGHGVYKLVKLIIVTNQLDQTWPYAALPFPSALLPYHHS